MPTLHNRCKHKSISVDRSNFIDTCSQVIFVEYRNRFGGTPTVTLKILVIVGTMRIYLPLPSEIVDEEERKRRKNIQCATPHTVLGGCFKVGIFRIHRIIFYRIRLCTKIYLTAKLRVSATEFIRSPDSTLKCNFQRATKSLKRHIVN